MAKDDNGRTANRKSRFEKLHRRVFLSVFLPCLALIVIVSSVSAGIMSNNLYGNYAAMARQYGESFGNSTELFLHSVRATVYNLSVNPAVTDELSESRGASLTAVLDDYCNYSLSIDALTVYSATGEIYTSSKVTGVPSLATLKENPVFSAFFEGESDWEIMLRNTDLARIYNNAAYREEYGVVSCVQKITSQEGGLLGYALADILPSTLYGEANSGNEYFADAVYFINSGESYLVHDSNDARSGYLTAAMNGSSRTADNKAILTVSESYGEITCVVAAPLSFFTSQVLVVTAVFAACSALLITAAFFVGKKAARNISGRLDKLADKMERAAR